MASPPPDWTPKPDASDALSAAAGFEASGDLTRALEAYEAALARSPGDGDLLCALARLAARMAMPQQALALWDEVLATDFARLEALDGRGRALADLHRYAEAVDALRRAILDHPHEARLWNTLGVVLNQQGDSAAALSFFDEAVRLEPKFAAALYNRGDVHFDLGQPDWAEADFDAAAHHATSPAETAVIAFARALLALHRGQLGPGWDMYEARLSPDHPDAPVFEAPGARWTPEAALEGAHLLVVGEQGLGDEVMFASLLGDAATALGPAGLLSLAVEPRLVGLLRRSFPAMNVVPHATERRNGRAHRVASAQPHERSVDLWTPLGSLPRRFRRRLETFADAPAYLRPDPDRVAHWRRWLGDRRAAGLSWRSGLLAGRRRRHYPELAAWAPLLQDKGWSFVNLQYGATAEELAELEGLAGAPLLVPPGLDLRNDLDDLAALSAALDLVVSVPNATAALAAACGARVWFLSSPSAWTRLGTQGHPWYASTRSFAPDRFGAWGPIMADLAGRLRAQ